MAENLKGHIRLFKYKEVMPFRERLDGLNLNSQGTPLGFDPSPQGISWGAIKALSSKSLCFFRIWEVGRITDGLPVEVARLFVAHGSRPRKAPWAGNLLG